MAVIDSREQIIKQYLEQNNVSAAIEATVKLIEDCVQDKDFKNAEKLRKLLIEIDPMALSEILEVSELIEEAKGDSLDQSHKIIWSELYNKLSAEEGNALYYAMKEINYGVDEVVFLQGKKNSNLYFIEHGELKLIYNEGKRDHLIKTYHTGDITGVETFFSISFCTASLITLSNVKLKVLNRDTLKKLHTDCPALKTKISDYCLPKDQLGDIAKKGWERRDYTRFDMQGQVVAQLIGASGKYTGNRFKGRLNDISRGGISFVLNIPKPETARLLLGRSLFIKNIILSDNLKKDEKKMGVLKQKKAMIIRVSHKILSEYLIHLKFYQKMPQEIIAKLLRV